jgi:Domain of unknown function (DUF4863)
MTDDTASARTRLETCLRHLIPAVDAIDPAAPEAAMRHLNAAHPLDGPELTRVLALSRQGLAEGWLAPREAGPGVRFGRLAKDMGGYSVDAVTMASCKALGHTHTNGEINICFPLEGEPTFDGHPPGWVVFPPGSHHEPTVEGGTMLFVYFMPGGQVVWDPA